ncbi:WD40 repeat domain-containing protein, partial [Streptomyces lydicamycinicus]|uniref:WD40 repeat domain-containing protein n=1 Tax=Streptomyces lydicamycinicus TaxID=1546107 RepID=UPI00351DBF43
VQVWDLMIGTRPPCTLAAHVGRVLAVGVVELDGRPHAITGGEDGSLRVWTTGRQPRAFAAHVGGVRAVGVVELDGRPHAITGGDDGSVRVWDLTTGTQPRAFAAHVGGVRAVGVVELDGRPHAITGGNDGSVRVWDLTTGTCRTTFYCPARVSALTVTADAMVIVGFGHEVAALSLAPLKGRLS